VSPTVDHHPAAPADAFPAVMIERDSVLTFPYKLEVEKIQHFEKRHVGRNTLDIVGDKLAFRIPVLLPPDFQGEIHRKLKD
jgi:hypothetical protein